MNSYNSFITDNEAYRHILVNIVKNLKHVQVLNSKLVTSGRAVAHLMNFKNYENLNIGECFFDSVMISLEEIDKTKYRYLDSISFVLKKNIFMYLKLFLETHTIDINETFYKPS